MQFSEKESIGAQDIESKILMNPVHVIKRVEKILRALAELLIGLLQPPSVENISEKNTDTISKNIPFSAKHLTSCIKYLGNSTTIEIITATFMDTKIKGIQIAAV